MVSSTKWNHIKFFTSKVFHLPKQIESNKVNQKNPCESLGLWFFLKKKKLVLHILMKFLKNIYYLKHMSLRILNCVTVSVLMAWEEIINYVTASNKYFQPF